MTTNTYLLILSGVDLLQQIFELTKKSAILDLIIEFKHIDAYFECNFLAFPIHICTVASE